MKPTSNFFYSVLLTSSVIFASAWFFCSSTLMILSDFNFSADHTQFDVQKQTVQLNREKGTYCCFYQCGKHFYGLYSVLLLSTFSSVVVFFPLWLLRFLLHACAAGTTSALYSFICSYSGSGISAVSIDFCHFTKFGKVIFYLYFELFLLTLFLFLLLFLLMFPIFLHLLQLFLLIVTFFCYFYFFCWWYYSRFLVSLLLIKQFLLTALLFQVFLLLETVVVHASSHPPSTSVTYTPPHFLSGSLLSAVL